MNAKKSVVPLDILRNCKGKVISVELTGGETINGTVVRIDRSMNMLLKQCIRTGAEGDAFWKSRESLIRGASVRNVRMDERALVLPEVRLSGDKKRQPSRSNTNASGSKRARKN
ncbi:U6 snRNA-associated Sm-like protein LSm4 [Trypanosoma grayi]|uniref:U6 snRNA-associated Sm-like protein LSm4 n=1 Tax=Trypanosoma grayi TaxID=71804 RepID=UPI0004F467CF|nr:U6 snRNA-associated Sm-like protein LSm4 [Trypanosoma grayi]KEG14740.1 U6 snRNA-associated Sm-like protein LSm4 [Trypanosoma grayi]